MTAKEYLEQAKRSEQRIETLLDQLQTVEELAKKCTTIITGMPHGQRTETSVIESAVCKSDSLKHEIETKLSELDDLKVELISTVYEIDDSDCRDVLIGHYLNYKTWAMIAMEFNRSERWIHKLHSKGLREIDKILSERDGQSDGSV